MKNEPGDLFQRLPLNGILVGGGLLHKLPGGFSLIIGHSRALLHLYHSLCSVGKTLKMSFFHLRFSEAPRDVRKYQCIEISQYLVL